MSVDAAVVLILFAIFIFTFYLSCGIDLCIKRLDKIMEMLRIERLDKVP